ncbi:hypothetical protein BJ546DRAFT_925583 [Cryomyces antarcticus]
MDTLSRQLEDQRALRNAAKAHRGLKPVDKPPKTVLLAMHSNLLASQLLTNSQGQLEVSVVGEAYAPSFVALRDLRKATIRDLVLETHHRGTVLIVKVLTLPLITTSIIVVVEDEHGEAERLALYNQDPLTSPLTVCSRGLIVAVKEPYLEANPAGGHLIRVDHVSDLLLLSPIDEIVPSGLRPDVMEVDVQDPSKCRVEGNKALGRKDFFGAITYYTTGLSVSNSLDYATKAILYRNRAQAYLILKRFESAKADAEASLLIEKDNIKSLYRAAQSAYELGQYEECSSRLKALLHIDAGNSDGLRELRRVQSRLLEQNTGSYDFLKMSEAVTRVNVRLDHASFTGRTIVRPAGTCGRGLFTTVSLKAGDLILCEKAFAATYGDDIKYNHNITYNLNTNRVCAGTAVALSVELIQKAYRNPSLGSKLVDLCSGSYGKTGNEQCVFDGVPVVDTFLIQHILEHNVFHCSRTRSSDEQHEARSARSAAHAYLTPAALWLQASYINHSCSYNSIRSFVGDMIILQATRDIPKDTEITLAYVEPETDVRERRRMLQRQWNFRCDCSLCIVQAKQSDTIQNKRLTLKQELSADFEQNQRPAGLSDDDILRLEELTQLVKGTYDTTSDEPRLALVSPLLWLAAAYSSRRDHSKRLEHALAAVRSLGFVVDISSSGVTVNSSNGLLTLQAIDALMHASRAYDGKGERAVARNLECVARRFYVICFGECRGFEEMYWWA